MAATRAFNLVVIGGGSGGIATARRAAQHGAKVALIEKAPVLGGTCVNVGCVPKKVMYHAADMVAALAMAPQYGVMPVAAATFAHRFDLAKLKEARDAYVHRLNEVYATNMASNGVTVIHGTAAFRDPHTIALDDGETTVTGDHFVIATGSKPRPLHLDVGGDVIMTSDDVWALTAVPPAMAIVGGGYIAVEMAFIFAAAGSTVHLILRGSLAEGALLRPFDSMLQSEVAIALAEAGVTIHQHFDPAAIVPADGASATSTEDGVPPRRWDLVAKSGARLTGLTHVLAAVGRDANTAGLALSAAGVATDDAGHVIVNAHQTTNVPHIHAVGDVIGRWQLTPVAIAAGRLLCDRLFGGLPTAHLSYRDIPTIVFSHPPIGTVGKTEEEAMARHGADRVKVFKAKFTPLVYGITAAKPKMSMKLVTVRMEEEEAVLANHGRPVVHDNQRLRVVGLHVIGPGADEMLQGFAVAVRMGATKADFDSSVALHPTAAEEFVTMAPWFPNV